MKCFPYTKTISGASASVLIYKGSCWFVNFKLGMDNANDPLITIYDSIVTPTPGTDTELVPTNPYDASAMALNGISSDESYATNGIWLVVTAIGGGAYGGAVDVTIGIWPGNILSNLMPSFG